jgi:hypothetical protein
LETFREIVSTEVADVEIKEDSFVKPQLIEWIMTHKVEDFRDEDYKTSIREYYEFKFDRAD